MNQCTRTWQSLAVAPVTPSPSFLSSYRSWNDDCVDDTAPELDFVMEINDMTRFNPHNDKEIEPLHSTQAPIMQTDNAEIPVRMFQVEAYPVSAADHQDYYDLQESMESETATTEHSNAHDLIESMESTTTNARVKDYDELPVLDYPIPDDVLEAEVTGRVATAETNDAQNDEGNFRFYQTPETPPRTSSPMEHQTLPAVIPPCNGNFSEHENTAHSVTLDESDDDTIVSYRAPKTPPPTSYADHKARVFVTPSIGKCPPQVLRDTKSDPWERMTREDYSVCSTGNHDPPSDPWERMTGEDYSVCSTGHRSQNSDPSERITREDHSVCSAGYESLTDEDIWVLHNTPIMDIAPEVGTAKVGTTLGRGWNTGTSVQTKSGEPRRFAHWTPEEDEILKQAVKSEEGHTISWTLISKKYFDGKRNMNQCKGRWAKLQRSTMPWTSQENEFIVECRRLNESFSSIAKKLHGRTMSQIREHYNNVINPILDKSPLTEEEKHIIFQKQKEVGNKWSTIARFLKGRSETQIKNCWHNAKMSQRRRLNKIRQTGATA